MGIPSLFRTLTEKYDVSYWDSKEETDQLYLDYNCLIHHCIHKVDIKEGMSKREIDEEVITEVVRYTCYLITRVIKPKKLVFIAVDGPVPMGKLVKQRARRYKKVQDDAYKRTMQKQFGIEVTDAFDSSKITPGTVFMTKLCNRLKNVINIGAFSTHTQDGSFKVFLSDANVPGEGEQKIMQFIRNGRNRPNGESPSVTIYGMDADLIILAMTISVARNCKTTLLREGDIGEFVYLNVAATIDALIKEYNIEHLERTAVVRDFVFFSFFGGNDFVDAFVHTKMRNRGLDVLFNSYKKALVKTDSYSLIADGVPNFTVLQAFIQCIAELEERNVKAQAARIAGSCLKLQGLGEYEKGCELYEHSFYANTLNPFHNYYKADMCKVDYRNDAWKEQYNNEYFGNFTMKDVCNEYIKGLCWTLEYYEKGEPPSWKWAYPYRNAPLSSALFAYLNGITPRTYANLWNFTKSPEDKCLSPVAQLLAVLPPQNASLLPYAFYNFVKDNCGTLLARMYPNKVKLDALKGLKNIYSEPLLDPINLNMIREMLLMIPFNQAEFNRNVVKTRIFCWSKSSIAT